MFNSGQARDRNAYLKGLRQARRFLDRPVPIDVIDDLLAVARGTGEPRAAAWRFQVVDDLVTRKALSRVGPFSEFLAQVPIAIVLVVTDRTTPSKATPEGQVSDRIMVAAGNHGLAGGIGWFGSEESREAVADVLGLPPGGNPWWAVGVGYVDESDPEQQSSLQDARKTINRLASHESGKN